MNDRFLFRGKRLDNGEWIEGYYLPRYFSFRREEPYKNVIVVIQGNSGVADLFIEVDPATLGQCTGLKDKNGTLIFEGDIIGNLKPHGTFNPTVQFFDGAFWLADFHLSFCAEKAEIIGNLHDNPELMEIGEDR